MLHWYQKNRKIFACMYGLIYLLSSYVMLLSYVPKQILLPEDGSSIALDIPVTVEHVYEEKTVETETKQNAIGSMTNYKCKLFGFLPIATISATKVSEQSLQVVGQPVGIYLKMKHVYVVGKKEMKTADGQRINPTEFILQDGDYISQVNGRPLHSKEALLTAVKQSQGKELELSIIRGGTISNVLVQPVLAEDGTYKLGLWVKDDIAGVGTMTYIDESGQFGALGHGISDSSTKALVQLEQGFLYHTDITEVKPSSMGSPGELTGLISYGASTRLGKVERNASDGIYGTISQMANLNLSQESYPVGYKQEVKRDAANILFGEEGNVKSYQIVIDKIDFSPKEENKAFVFHVTDQELIKEMGGIVQGMSGSPIIQNGKIIGAVTHVFVNDPTKGYGIFIEDMLN